MSDETATTTTGATGNEPSKGVDMATVMALLESVAKANGITAPRDKEDDDDFAVSPQMAVTGKLNFKNKGDHKVFLEGAKPLYGGEKKFDGTPGNMTHFLNLLRERAEWYGWNKEPNGILNIPKDIDKPENGTDMLLDAYGTIEFSQVVAWEDTYLRKKGRQAQDSAMLYQCLMASMTDEFQNKALLYRDKFNKNGKKYGVALLKIILRESHLDTNATISTLKTRLSSLDVYMGQCNSDIIKFNEYVKVTLGELHARGEHTSDLLVNLFKGYRAAADPEFVRYINTKKEQYDDNTTAYTPDELMLLAANKYRLLIEENEWKGPSQQEEKIVALDSRVVQQKGKKTKNQPKNKDSKSGGRKPDWLFKHVPPKGNETKTRTWNETTYYWCSEDTGGKCDGKWRAHAPPDCRGRDFMANKANGLTPGKRSNSPGRQKSGKGTKRLQLVSSLQSICSKLQQAEDEEDP